MDVLIGWDSAREAETIGLLLNTGDMRTQVTTNPAELIQASATAAWDTILLALNFPSVDESFALFEKVRELQPETPILGACQTGEIVHIARFFSHGLHNLIARDPHGEFIILLPTVIESAHAATQALRSRQLTTRLREEIESVRQLQQSVIPREISVPAGYQIAARYEPSEIRVLGDRPVILAGGDYYDLYTLDDRNVVVLVGDAAGHGIKACMSIMVVRTLIHMIRDQGYTDVAQFVADVNRRLIEHAIVSSEDGFITLLYGVLDTYSGTFQWTSAGHPVPLLQDLQTGDVRPLDSDEMSGLPLGINAHENYRAVKSLIPTNSRLLLYSDGLADAFPASRNEWCRFGESGIKNSLGHAVRHSLDEALDKLFADSNAFTQGSGRHDDTSAVLIERA